MLRRNRISMEQKERHTGLKDDFKAGMILDNMDMLTDGQRYAIDRIIGDKHGKIFFLSGKAGTGKSTVISVCKAMIKKLWVFFDCQIHSVNLLVNRFSI